MAKKEHSLDQENGGSGGRELQRTFWWVRVRRAASGLSAVWMAVFARKGTLEMRLFLLRGYQTTWKCPGGSG